MSRSDPERLRDILECIEAIDRAEVTVARYPGDPDVAKIALDAVESRVFTIGEAVRGLSLGLSALPGRALARHGPYGSCAPPSVRPSNGFGPHVTRLQVRGCSDHSSCAVVTEDDGRITFTINPLARPDRPSLLQARPPASGG